MLTFFACVEQFAKRPDASVDFTLITDRLYRRYIALQDAEEAPRALEKVEAMWRFLRAQEINWALLPIDETSQLDVRTRTLVDVFKRYFYALRFCFESAALLNQNGHVAPLRTVNTALAAFTNQKGLPQQELDERIVPVWVDEFDPCIACWL